MYVRSTEGYFIYFVTRLNFLSVFCSPAFNILFQYLCISIPPEYQLDSVSSGDKWCTTITAFGFCLASRASPVLFRVSWVPGGERLEVLQQRLMHFMSPNQQRQSTDRNTAPTGQYDKQPHFDSGYSTHM